MKIGIDIDEIIAEFVRGYLELSNYLIKKNLIFEDVFTYCLWEPLGITRKEAYELAEEYYNSKDFENIMLVEGAKEGIKKLNKRHELIFVTARPNYIREKTKLFIKKILPNSNFKIFHSD